MRVVRAISFDLDETLWSLDQVIERAEQRTRAFLIEQLPAVASHWGDQGVVHLRQQVLAEAPDIAHDVGEIRRRVLRRLVVSLGAPEQLADQAFTVFLDARHEVRVFDATRPLLDTLRQRYVLLALTNGNADVDRIGIGHYFKAALSAADVGAAKPSAAMFNAALQAAGTDVDGLIHVGDDPETDVFGAARRGIRAVWLNRDRRPWPQYLPPVAHHCIERLEQLPALLQASGRTADHG